jgi:hypothetical protein
MSDRDAWLHDQLDGATARKNGEVLAFLPDGTPSPETEHLLRSVREACDRFWARRRALKISKKNLLPDSTR